MAAKENKKTETPIYAGDTITNFNISSKVRLDRLPLKKDRKEKKKELPTIFKSDSEE